MAHDDLVILDWVPAPVRTRARKEYAWAKKCRSREDAELIARLAQDQRMRGVWRELTRRKRGGLHFLHPAPQIVKGEDERARQDTALEDFFFYVSLGALLPFSIQTCREAEVHRAQYLEAGLPLLKSAKILLGDGTLPVLEECADRAEKLLGAVEVLNELASEAVDNGPYQVKRDRGRGRAQAYSIFLCDLTKKYFGTPLYFQVAEIASVALNEPVSPRTVRSWCAAPRE